MTRRLAFCILRSRLALLGLWASFKRRQHELHQQWPHKLLPVALHLGTKVSGVAAQPLVCARGDLPIKTCTEKPLCLRGLGSGDLRASLREQLSNSFILRASVDQNSIVRDNFLLQRIHCMDTRLQESPDLSSLQLGQCFAVSCKDVDGGTGCRVRMPPWPLRAPLATCCSCRTALPRHSTRYPTNEMAPSCTRKEQSP